MASDLVLFLTERVEVNKTGGGTTFVRGELTGLTNVKLKRADNPAVVVAGTEIPSENGFYKFSGFDAHKNWKLFVNDVEKATYGADNGRWIGTDTLGGVFVMLTPAGAQTVTGIITFTGAQQFFAHPFRIAPLPSEPEYGNSLAWKQWVETYVQAQISAIEIQAYQYSPRVIEVFGEATQVAGKVYQTMLSASQYAYGQTPSANKRYSLWIKGVSASSSLINANSGTMKSYIDWFAQNQGFGILCQDSSCTAYMDIHNAMIYLGANDVVTDREFTGHRFHNCTIYHYKELTITAGQLDHCKVVSFTGKKCHIKGTGGVYTDVFGTIFNTEPEIVGGADDYGGVLNYAIDTHFVVPSDPSLPT